MPNYFGVQAVQPIDRQNRVAYTATSGQISFFAIYTPGYVDVYKNGAKLKATDFTATNGTSISLGVAATAGDYVEIIGIKTSSPYDFYTKAQTNQLINRFSMGVTGTGDAMVFSTAIPTLASMTDGTEFVIRTPSANTIINPTVNLTSLSLGTKTITAAAGSALIIGAWAAGADIVLRYNAAIDKLELIGVGTTFATNAQVVAGTSTSLLLSPAGLKAAFTGTSSIGGASGYQKLPSGLILQWGSITTNTSSDAVFTFPIAFPNGCRSVQGTYANGFGSAAIIASLGSVTATTAAVASYTTGGARATSSIYLLAVGD